MALTTFEHIEAHAARSPRRLALAAGTDVLDYAQMHAGVARLTRMLAALGVRRGEWVAVSRAGFAVQFLLLIACENLGAVSVPFSAQGDPEIETVLAKAHWVFSEEPQDGVAGRFQLVDDAFMARVAAIDLRDGTPCPRVTLAPGDPQRLSRTSGSTGRSRFMVMTRQAQEWWLRVVTEDPRCNPDARVLVASPLLVNTAFIRASGTLRGGGAVLCTPAPRAMELGITDFSGLPVQLEKFMDELPAGFAAPRPVTVHSAGGFLREDLRQRALRVLGGPVLSRYGANEVGPVTLDLDTHGVGNIREGVDVRIVDEGRAELPAGTLGAIEARSPAMVAGYVDAPEATAAAFQDGWFRTGDLGQIVGPRRLKVWGRHDDLVNLGGIKVPAAQLEGRIRPVAGVRDCAVLAINAGQGAMTVGIALELNDGATPAEVEPRLAEVLPLDAGTRAQVLYMKALPRTAVGKIDRVALHRLLQTVA